ncbi:MAG TPA: TadE/TadG family type IV pilus assembly protein, partial [Sphingomicrobium sp.]
ERAGNVTVELALLAPILSAMLIGLVDLSTAYSAKLRLEQVAQRSIEKVMQNSFAVSQAATLKTEAEAAAGSGSTATVTYWLECNAVKQTGASAYTSNCPDGQQYARYVQVQISKSHTAIIANTTWTLVGVAGIRIQ